MLEGAQILPPSKQPRYPHMFKRDIAIWERFLLKHGNEFEGFIYDWKVGSGTEPVAELTEPYVTMQKTLSRYRVDVIGLRNHALCLMEVKPMAGTGSLGQIISYTKLFRDEHKSELKLIPYLITDFERPDMRKLASDYGIKYYIV